MIPSLNLTSSQPIAICWLRRDLRLDDHRALYEALTNHPRVLPLFIFDPAILDKLCNPKDARVQFIHAQLMALHTKLTELGSSLLVVKDDPIALFKELIREYSIEAVYANEDYEPYATRRDKEVGSLLASQHIPFHTCKDQVIFSPGEILKKDGTPYTVYTPYMKAWKASFKSHIVKPFDLKPYYTNFLPTYPLTPLPTLQALGFLPTPLSFPPPTLDTSLLTRYANQRNHLAKQGTTRLGVHLRFGTISIRTLTYQAYTYSDTWLNQLIWRNFFMMILAHFPHVTEHAFKPAYDRILWRADREGFQRWCIGETGYPIIDAAMRELNTTGFMHNRGRMITASFLTKLLLIDWRWGEAYFAEKLLDYELASNNGGWQWAAGTGCDAAPYFRIFNPMRQTERFDPSHNYIKKWVPEYRSSAYPKPMVEYSLGRQRALEVYQKALKPIQNI